jgi:menaquinone-dependent protoporphyrinogen oxidase
VVGEARKEHLVTRTLVVYASHYGQTRKIAKRIAEQLRAHGHVVELADARVSTPPPPERYDLVVIGSRVETGHHAREIHAYINAHLSRLRAMPTAFFSVSMAAARRDAGPDPDGYMHAMFDELGWHPRCYVAFAGGLPYRQYGLFTRLVMRQISKSAGHTTDTSRDHELTDWGAVERFAGEVAALVPVREDAVAPP